MNWHIKLHIKHLRGKHIWEKPPLRSIFWSFLEYLSLEEMDMNTVLWLDGDNGQIELNQAHFHSLTADVNYSNKRGDNPNILVMFQAARWCSLITKADDSALLNVSSSQHCRTEINWTFTSQCDNCHV